VLMVWRTSVPTWNAGLNLLQSTSRIHKGRGLNDPRGGQWLTVQPAEAHPVSRSAEHMGGPRPAFPSPSVSVSLLFGASVAETLAGFTTVWMHGNHSGSTTWELSEAIRRASNLDAADVMVDFSDVDSIDLGVIDVIVKSTANLEKRSLFLRSRCPSPSTSEFAELHGFGWLFSTHRENRAGNGPAREFGDLGGRQPTGEFFTTSSSFSRVLVATQTEVSAAP
jgi:anti-anti-sigma regulatory factor